MLMVIMIIMLIVMVMMMMLVTVLMMIMGKLLHGSSMVMVLVTIPMMMFGDKFTSVAMNGEEESGKQRIERKGHWRTGRRVEMGREISVDKIDETSLCILYQ